jgi:expansin (peptidoglycan-binding protein)
MLRAVIAPAAWAVAAAVLTSGESLTPYCPATLPGKTGVATYYAADGSGHCGFDPSADLMVTAVAAPDWANSGQCGGCLEVVGPEARVVVRVVDSCPGCPANHLDLSAEAFDVIANPMLGVVPISFHPVPCGVAGNVSIKQKDGVNNWWWAVQIRNHRYPIATIELLETGSGAWQNMAGQDYNYFVLMSGAPSGLAFPVQLRITDIHQHQLLESVASIVAEAETPGAGQFPPCDGLFADGFEG